MLFQTCAFFLFFLATFTVFRLAPRQTPRLAWLPAASVVFYGF